MSTNRKNIDPIVVAVLDSRLSAITKEMANSMMRTSRSPIFFEARDFVTALFTRDLKLIAQTDYIPILAGAIPTAVYAIAKAYEGDIKEGDIFIHNDPYSGNNHLPDTNIVKPIFYKGELAFWVVAKGHLANIGGSGICSYNPKATTIWEDGLVIPPCKLYDAGKYNRPVWDLVKYNCRVPELVLGDITCEVGAVTIGERRLTELCDRYGLETIFTAIDEIIKATERAIKSKFRQIPDGIYYGESAIDHDMINRDKPVWARVEITKKGENMTLDFSKCDPQVAGFINSSWANTYSSAHIAVFLFLPGGEVKRNEAFLKAIDIIAPKGTWVNPEFPKPVTVCTMASCDAIVQAVMLALSKAVPEWAIAPGGLQIQTAVQGFNPRTKRQFSGLDFICVTNGGGATEGYDGWQKGGSMHTLGQVRFPDFEVMELVWPMRVLQHEQIIDNEGYGKFIGAAARIYRTQYIADMSCVLNGYGMRDFASPQGLFGGGNAQPGRYTIHRKDGSTDDIDVGDFFELKAGDITEQYIQGGAGFGKPMERDPERVLKDIYNGIISVERAKEIYGVVIEPETLKIDTNATKKHREKYNKPAMLT